MRRTSLGYFAACGLDNAFNFHCIEGCRRIEAHEPIRVVRAWVRGASALPDHGVNIKRPECRPLFLSEVVARDANNDLAATKRVTA